MDEEVAALTEDSIKETESAEENTDIEPEMDNYSDEVQESERTIKVYFSEEASQKSGTDKECNRKGTGSCSY